MEVNRVQVEVASGGDRGRVGGKVGGGGGLMGMFGVGGKGIRRERQRGRVGVVN